MDIEKVESFKCSKEDIKHIKEWVKKQPHLPQEYDDGWLENFLICCKFRVERCKKLLDVFYTSRNLFPYYFTNRDPTSDEIRNISQKQFRFMLPEYSSDGYPIFINAISDTDTSSYLCQDDLKKLMMTRDACVATGKFDLIVILDSKDFTASHTPAILCNIKILVSLILKATPVRIKQIHIVNTNRFAKAAHSAVLPFLKEKMRNRFHIHTANLQSLYEHIPKKILPMEYGGQAGTMKELNDKWQIELESMRDWFLTDEKRKTDESKRVKCCDMNNDMFGADGSFKTLSID